MKYKITFLPRIALMVLLLITGGSAFALQDTTGNSKGKKIDSDLGRPDRSQQGGDAAVVEEEVTDDEGDDGTVTNEEQTEHETEYGQEVKKHEFDKKKWEETTKDLNYLDDVQKKQEQEKEEAPTVSSSQGFSLFSGGFVKILLFTLIFIGLAFVLYMLFGGTFARNTRIGDGKVFTIEDIEDKLHESDLDRLLREALARGDFRLAVRIYYLAIIKELSVKDWIRWKKDKTNREYLNEMIARKPDLYNGFRDATIAFERVWYGDLEIKENEFNMLSPRFRNFMDSITRTQ